jgi:hypothetical protein
LSITYASVSEVMKQAKALASGTPINFEVRWTVHYVNIYVKHRIIKRVLFETIQHHPKEFLQDVIEIKELLQ